MCSMRALVNAWIVISLLHLASAETAFAGAVLRVAITDLAFAPVAIAVSVGDTIEWVNDDIIDHTATAKSGEWDVLVPVGTSARLLIAHAGTLEYFCRFHPNMTGTIRSSAN